MDVLLESEEVDLNYNHGNTTDLPLACAVKLRLEAIFEWTLNSRD